MTISLIIPCYNEELNIQKGVLDRIGNFIQPDSRFIEVIIVDDGSTDTSLQKIKQNYLSKFKKFRLVENKHQGKAYAIITGIQEAKGDYIVFSDIDLATPIEESRKLIAEAERGGAIVIGSRSSRREGAPFFRRLMAIGFIIVRDLLINLKGVHDTQCGFKMFRRDVAKQIISNLQVFKKGRRAKGSAVSAGFDLEFLFLANKMGYHIVEVPVSWRHVETKNVNFFHDSIETVRDIVKIKYMNLAGKYRPRK